MIAFHFEKSPAYYIQSWRCSCKFKSRWIGSRSGEFSPFGRLFTLGGELYLKK
jgi:hypothetical protein